MSKDRARVIFGNKIAERAYRKSVKGKRKCSKKYGDDSKKELYLTISDNKFIGDSLGVRDINISTRKQAEGKHGSQFMVACDVTNPLCGTDGCSAVYGPQKGATPSMIMDMDKWLGSYADMAKKLYPNADAKYPGTGAAGGMGFAFLTFLNAFSLLKN